MRLGYRVRQLWRTITAAPLSFRQWEDIQRALSSDEYELFLRYDTSDQQHCYRVMRAIADSGEENQDLLVAALLHDVGKTQIRLSSLDRILGTVVERSMPGRLERWGSAAPEGWHKPFAVRVQHADWGAQLAEQAGSSPRTVCLIKRHQDKIFESMSAEDAELLRRLQWADEQN